MTALAQDITRGQDTLPMLPPNEAHVQIASSTIYKGAMMMQVTGVVRPAASGVASSVALGVALRRYTNTSVGVKVYPNDEPMVAQRGVFAFEGKAGDLPDETLINVVNGVSFEDDNTVKKTAA